MISIKDKKDCCGCSSCVQSCPKKCITLRQDVEGFLYPSVDETSCIGCGKCEKACPMLHEAEKREPEGTFAAVNPDEAVRLHSSSGGIFSLLSEYVIRRGGVVFGAAFNEKWEVVHGYSETLEGLAAFRGSKYVQSRIGTAYSDAERFLKDGRLVLFSGTPCQIAGLRRYLGKGYGNLLAVDFICHGVPSPGIFNEYLDVKSRKGKITGVNFRDKAAGWKTYSVTFEYAGADSGMDSRAYSDRDSCVYNTDPYMIGFLSNLTLRPSCYACRFREGRSGSDITLGDFWGINKIRPDLDDDKGLSLVTVRTPQAAEILRSLHCPLTEMNLEEAVRHNPSIRTSVAIPTNRGLFFKLRKHFGLIPALKLCGGNFLLIRALRKAARLTMTLVNKVRQKTLK